VTPASSRPYPNPDFKVRLTEPDYRYMGNVVEGIGVNVIGRRLFGLTDGWAPPLSRRQVTG